MPPFPFGTASGLVMYSGNNPPAYAGKKFDLITVIMGFFYAKKGIMQNSHNTFFVYFTSLPPSPTSVTKNVAS